MRLILAGKSRRRLAIVAAVLCGAALSAILLESSRDVIVPPRLTITGGAVDGGEIGLSRAVNSPDIVGGADLRNDGQTDLVIERIDVDVSSDDIEVLGVYLLDPDQTDHGQVGAVCGRISWHGFDAHPVEGYRLHPGEMAYVTVVLRSRGRSPGRVEKLTVSYRSVGGDRVVESSAPWKVFYVPGATVRCLGPDEGARVVDRPPTYSVDWADLASGS